MLEVKRYVALCINSFLVKREDLGVLLQESTSNYVGCVSLFVLSLHLQLYPKST